MFFYPLRLHFLVTPGTSALLSPGYQSVSNSHQGWNGQRQKQGQGAGGGRALGGRLPLDALAGMLSHLSSTGPLPSASPGPVAPFS